MVISYLCRKASAIILGGEQYENMEITKEKQELMISHCSPYGRKIMVILIFFCCPNCQNQAAPVHLSLSLPLCVVSKHGLAGEVVPWHRPGRCALLGRQGLPSWNRKARPRGPNFFEFDNRFPSIWIKFDFCMKLVMFLNSSFHSSFQFFLFFHFLPDASSLELSSCPFVSWSSWLMDQISQVLDHFVRATRCKSPTDP